MTRAVTDILYRTDGAPWASAPVTFERKAGSFDDGSSWPPDEKQVTTDETGAYSVQLWPDASGSLHSHYRVSYPNGDTFYVSIPDGTTPISMPEIRIAPLVQPVPPSALDAHVAASDPHAGYLLPGEADLLYAPIAHSQAWATITATPTTIAGYGITDAFTQAAADLRYAPISHNQAWFTITGTPTTVAGYGISDVYTKAAADARYAPMAHNQAWSTITATPTTLGGYGITDAFTQAAADLRYAPISHNQAWSTITGTPTTVAGYGISDVYTQTQSNANLALKANLAGGNTLTGVQTIQTTDAGTTTVPGALVVAHRSTGTPAAGFGVGLSLTANSSTTADRPIAATVAQWADATDATRSSYLDLQTVQAGTLASRFRVDNYGVQIDPGATLGNVNRRLQVANKAYNDPPAQFDAIFAQPQLHLTADNANVFDAVTGDASGNDTAFNHTGNVQGGRFFAQGRQLTPGSTTALIGVTATGQSLAQSTGNYTGIYGVSAVAYSFGLSGTVANLTAGLFSATHRTGQSNGTDASITQAVGVSGVVQNIATNGGVIANGYALYAAAPGGAGAITNNYGLRIINQGRAGITNAWGMQIDAQSGASSSSTALYTAGGQVRHDTGSAATIGLIVRAAASQTANLQEWQDSGGAVLARTNKAGYRIVSRTAAPADADLVAGELTQWFDQTTGAAKLMIKGKNAAGAVVTGSVALT